MQAGPFGAGLDPRSKARRLSDAGHSGERPCAPALPQWHRLDHWTKRYPWIAEAALKNRQKHFVIDGEAVILGVDGVSDFNGLHYRTGAFPGGLPHGP